MSLTELLDQAIRLYRRNFLQFVGIIAIVQIPLTLLSLIVSLATMGGSFAQLDRGYPSSGVPLLGSPEIGILVGMLGNMVIAIASFILVSGVATAALTRAIADQYLGQPIDFIEAYVSIGGLWKRVIGALFLAGLIGIGLGLWFLVPCVGWFTGLGIGMFWTNAIVPLIAPIVVLERQRPTSAIRRAWDLTRRRFWWVAGYVGLLYLLNQVIVSGPGALINLVFQALTESMIESGGMGGAFTIQVITQSVFSLIASLIYVPLQLTGITLMYFDLRVRTEGFDLTLLAQSASEDVSVTEVVSQAPRPETIGLVTGKEMGYFVLISLIAIALIIVVILVLGVLGTVLGLGAGVPPGF
jgi:hypothetical protein